MKCAQHIERDAVGSCQGCQLGLCQDCAKRFGAPYCAKCKLKDMKVQSKGFYFQLGISILLVVIGYYTWVRYFHGGIFESLIPAALLAGFYWGWSFFSKKISKPSKKPQRSKWLSFLLYGAYYLVLLLLSIALGFLIGIYKILMNVKTMRDVKMLERECNEQV